jgi:signal transduction histidine kinase
MDLLNEINMKQEQLSASLKRLRQTGSEYAKAERDYKVLLRQEVLKLRNEGEAIGVIQLTCYGIPSVAEARFKRDVAEAIYRANQEAINTLKLEIRLIESQLEREWINISK